MLVMNAAEELGRVVGKGVSGLLHMASRLHHLGLECLSLGNGPWQDRGATD